MLPTIFVPGFPKAATTWLYDCMHAAFPPEMVCPPQSRDEFDGRRWSIAGCGGRRFMLPGIACRVVGGCEHRKELFFYGYGTARSLRAQTSMARLHGPEVRAPAFAEEAITDVALLTSMGREMLLENLDEIGIETSDATTLADALFPPSPAPAPLPLHPVHPRCCSGATSSSMSV